ncbi:putative multiple inositol polyphosphate phosphatase 1-like [Scophthalmus maximus]|uniref:Multiple inositol polyphosphate phosphatase 1 n=1 Tax=Scophthalmus maximus TaxID=52904 RepID=A0A2U9CDM4_SCOMX|nr:putative multiple inositol polyphosphate phosphatase 1-like [Scophthalmus maximus]
MQLFGGVMSSALWKVAVVHLTATVGLSCCFRGQVKAGDDLDVPAIAKYFSTKGRYEEVNPYLREDILAVNRSALRPPFAQCREIHLTAIVRHGTRYPTAKNVRKMRKLYDLVRDRASGRGSWLQEIKSQWPMWYTEDMDGRLVRKGVSDHKHLAVRLSKLFPSLVSEEKLRGGHVRFVTSSKHRCVNSTLSFVAGLTELWAITDKEFDHVVNDALMRFFDKCTKFVQEVDNNPSALSEVDQFKKGPEMRRVQEKIADRLNVPYDTINDDMAEAAFYMCAYEFAIKTVNSPWCRLFDEVDAKVMEYANDLKQFWKRSYGHDINSKSSCILFHDVFSRLDKAVNENQPAGDGSRDSASRPCRDPPATAHPAGLLQGQRGLDILQLRHTDPPLLPHQPHVALRSQLTPGAVRLWARRPETAATAQREACDFPWFS